MNFNILSQLRGYFGQRIYCAVPPIELTDADRRIAATLLKCSGAEIKQESGPFGFIFFQASRKQVKTIKRRLPLFVIQKADIFSFQCLDRTTGTFKEVPVDEALRDLH